MTDPCEFCQLLENGDRRFLYENDGFVAFHDKYPVSRGHTLIIPRTHCSTVDALAPSEGPLLLQAIQSVRSQLQQDYEPDGFNIGINERTAGGQTVSHLHCHVIPRYHGDVDDPEGGIRGVIPSKQKYRKDGETKQG